MTRLQFQRGFTFLEICTYLLMVGFFATALLKLGPMYMDDRAIARAIDNVHEQVSKMDIYEVTNNDIRGRLSKFFQVNMIDGEILKQIEVERSANQVMLKLNYETRTGFIGNIDIVAKFNHEVDLAAPYSK